MESGLTVEHNKIIGLHMSFHFVTNLQMKITGLGMVAQINTISIVSDDVFCSGIMIGTTINQLA